MDKYVELAKLSLETYINTHTQVEIPKDLSEEMLNTKAGAFVSIKINGKLRGCIGTIFPVQDCVANEIIDNAISAGTKDPRFSPVETSELELLNYSVDILGAAEKIDSFEKLDVKEYGVIVTNGNRRGLLLPDLEGVETPMQQVGIALNKAGIHPDEEYYLERFKVTRYGQK